MALTFITGLQLLLIAVAILLMWKGADWFVDGAVRIARRFEVSDLVIGLTLVGLATSAPEFAVSVGAALTAHGDISVGNVVGSNIFNLGFILGGCAAIRPIVTSRRLVLRDGLVLVGATIVLLLFAFDLNVSRVEGVVLMLGLVVYIGVLLHERTPLEEVEVSRDRPANRRDVKLALLGLAMIVGGGQLLVYAAVAVARGFGMPEWAIGVTIVAAGTSAPELVTSLNAAVKGRFGLSAGNLVGSDLFNLLGVLGVSAFIRPLTIDPAARSSLYLLVVMVAVVVVFMRTGWRVSRSEGLLLVGVNLVRWWLDIRGGSL